MNGYSLSRYWFDWCFENPEKINPNHSALYFFAIEHCNRLGWKEKFGLPTTMAKEAIGIKSYNTYIKTLRDLVQWGFIIWIEESKNQHSSNIVALSNFNKALDESPNKALDKALIKHATKHSESTSESIDSIIKQLTNEQLNQLTNKLLEKKKKENSENGNFPPPPENDFEDEKTETDEEIKHPKTKKPKKPKPKPKETTAILPWESEGFKSSWEMWKEYKDKEHGFKFRSPISEGISLKQLHENSNGSEQIAIKMIENAIAMNWKGIHQMKQQNQLQNGNGANNTGLVGSQQAGVNKNSFEYKQQQYINELVRKGICEPPNEVSDRPIEDIGYTDVTISGI